MNPKSFNDFLVLVTFRYFLIAGLAYLIYYVWLRKKIAFKKIQLAFPVGKDYRREIFYSLSSLFIFAAAPSIMLLIPEIKQHTQFYSGHLSHGQLYFWIAFPITFILHDTYFYFAHRFMHLPKMFEIFHVTHHKSTNPSPWAAFAFSIPEAIVEAGIFVLLLLIMPLCKWHLFVFFLVQMIYNVYGHLGWEVYPKGFNKNWFGKWINTSVNHNLHHKYFKGNYGLYFLWWDRIFGTIREDYDSVFEEVKSRLTTN